MSLVVDHTHYMPKKWRGKENSDLVRSEFETLFQVRFYLLHTIIPVNDAKLCIVYLLLGCWLYIFCSYYVALSRYVLLFYEWCLICNSFPSKSCSCLPDDSWLNCLIKVHLSCFDGYFRGPTTLQLNVDGSNLWKWTSIDISHLVVLMFWNI